VTTFLASFPSPPRGVLFHLGPFPIRWYALFIIVGIIVALIIGDRRWVARGGQPGVIYDIALWAVPFGLIGGRLYHVMTDWQKYFGPDGLGFLATLQVWEGGLGIWGAVALGGVGAWIGCRQLGIPLPAFGDAIAPGIVLAQAIGRLGNYFNQELYGRETSLPWGMKIYERRDASGAVDYLNGVSTGHVEKIVQPTFLYELIWNVLVFVLLIYVDRRFKLGHGRLFATYVAAYCVGRFCVELLRDDAATHVAGIRINSFTSVFVFIGAAVYLILAPKGREDPATLVGKPRERKEEPKAAKKKEEVPQKAESAEESALVEWTKELAAVAATSGVVAGVAVAAEHDEEDKLSADGGGEPVEGGADETAGPVEHEEPKAEAAAEGEVEAAPAAEAEEALEAEAEEGVVADEDAAEPEGEVAPAAEAEEAPEAEAEEEVEEEVVADEHSAEPEAEETAGAEAEDVSEGMAKEKAQAEAEPEVLSGQVTEESTGKLEPDEDAGEAAEPEEPGSEATEDGTVGAEASAEGVNGASGAPRSSSDVPEHAGAARRRWLPRLRNRAK
jgi:prolipoprotein diacylglyceryl transferase